MPFSAPFVLRPPNRVISGGVPLYIGSDALVRRFGSCPPPKIKPEKISISCLARSRLGAVRNQNDANILAYRGVAIRNFTLKPGRGFADYQFYVDGRVAGVIEAKREGVTRTGVSTQSDKYLRALPDGGSRGLKEPDLR